MRRMQLKDILDIAQYERVRPQYRADIIAHKQARRLDVGPMIWFSFETFETMLYQVQEMMRSERMVDERLIEREIAVFNELIPEKHQLSTTMMIAMLNEHQREMFLSQTTTLPQHTFMNINGRRLEFIFDKEQNSPTRISSVQFILCKLAVDEVEQFSSPRSRISIEFDHPLYRFSQEMPDALKATLAFDLTRD